MIKDIQLGETVSYQEIKQTIPDIDFPDFEIFQILDTPTGIYERRDIERDTLTFYEGNSKSIIKALGITDQEKTFPLHALTRHGRKHVLNLRCKSFSHYPWSMGIDFGTTFFVVVFCDDDGKIYLYLINIGKGETEPSFHPLREYLSKPYNYRLCHENVIVTARTSRIHAKCKMHSFAISNEERCYHSLKQLLDPHPDLYSVYVKANYGKPVEPIVTVLPELPELFFNRFVEDNASRRSFLLKDQTYIIFSASTAMGPRVATRLYRNFSRAFRLNSTNYLHLVDEGAASLIACVLAPGVKAEGTLEPNYEKYRKSVLKAFYKKLMPPDTSEEQLSNKVEDAVKHNFIVELLGLDRGGGSFDISKISVPFFVDKCHIDISRDFSFGEASGGGVYLDRVFKNYILLKVLEKTLAYAKEVHQQRLEDFGEDYIESAPTQKKKERRSVSQYFYRMMCDIREEATEEPVFEDNPVLVHKLHALISALLNYHALPDKPYFTNTQIYRQMLNPKAQKDCQPLDFLRDLISKSVLKHYYLDQSTFYTHGAAEESCSDSQIIYNIPMPHSIEYYDPHAQQNKKLDLTDEEGQELIAEYAKIMELLQYKLDFCTPINSFGDLLAEWLKITWSRHIYSAVHSEGEPDDDTVNLDVTYSLLDSGAPANEPVIRLWNQLSGGIPYSRAIDAWAQFCGYNSFVYKDLEKERKEGKEDSKELIREVSELLKEHTTIPFWHICRVIHPVVTAHITKAFYTLHLDADSVFLPPEASKELGNLVDSITGAYDYLYTAVTEGRKDLNPLRMNLLKSLLRGWDTYVKSQNVSQDHMYKRFEVYFKSFGVAYQEFRDKEPSIDDLDIVSVIIKLGEKFESTKKLSSVDVFDSIRDVMGLSPTKSPYSEQQMEETLRERDNINDEWTQSRGWIINQVEKWGDILAGKIETAIQDILFNPEFLQEVTEGEKEEDVAITSSEAKGEKKEKDQQWEETATPPAPAPAPVQKPKQAAEPQALPKAPAVKKLTPSEIYSLLKVILGGVPQDLGVTIDLPEKVSEESYELYNSLLSAAYALYSFPALNLYRKVLKKSGLDEEKNKRILEQISERSLYLKEASWLTSPEGKERYLKELDKIKNVVELFASHLKTIESRNQPLIFSVPKSAKEIREEKGIEHIFRGVVFTGQGFDLLYQYTGELAVHAFELNSNPHKEQVVFFSLTDLITTANVRQDEGGVLAETSLAKVLTSLGLCYLGICYRGAGMQYDIRKIYISPRVASTIYYRGDIQQVDLPPSVYQFNENFSYGSIFYNPQTFQLRIISHHERSAIEELSEPWISLVENAFFFVDESFLRADGEKVPDDRDGQFRTNWNISSEVNEDRSAASFWVSPHLQLKEGCPLLPPEERYHLVQMEITNPILFFQNLRALRPGKQHRLSYLYIPFTFGRWATNQQEVLIFFRHEIYSGSELEELRFYPVVDPLPHGQNEKFLEYTHSNPGFFTGKQQIGFNDVLREHYKELQAQGEYIAPFEKAPIFPILPGNMHNVLREDSHGACFLKLAKPATFSTRENFISEGVKKQLRTVSEAKEPEITPAKEGKEKTVTMQVIQDSKKNSPPIILKRDVPDEFAQDSKKPSPPVSPKRDILEEFAQDSKKPSPPVSSKRDILEEFAQDSKKPSPPVSPKRDILEEFAQDSKKPSPSQQKSKKTTEEPKKISEESKKSAEEARRVAEENFEEEEPL